ncbi:mitochondrial import inner membrane translocase subunit Tim21 [Orussus abietinus]|uniref:mitochondrial import inner membrane translocase subunit Tim21 n=1 Tax=Orussus abietinus TaxID=222816 RepID=UPI000626D21B|nr:mitochondrial import inner membrane translocase subunit Tim21 [Orussus abietinus]XP_012283330.1 mitochondrial import inner membrane translocase subunit Tim21 [Orussus abietinus]XP_012283339.1 mitochondrial import inner membrane translocase subunit Tim21 [Orussus abietinus]XP_012283348.1 mitochondrial import inner membrane translocase subunit Tim21 [Orussus abietinus]
MALSRAVNVLIRQNHFVFSGRITVSSQFLNPLSNTIHTYGFWNQKSVTKVDSKESSNQLQTGFMEVAKENVKSAWYLIVIVLGIGVTSVVCYTIGKELFSSNSPNGVYKAAMERCITDPKVIDALGEPISVHGTRNRRGRGNHPAHEIYQRDGVNHMRMQFFIQGSRKHGTVHLEVYENETGNYVYKYLFVQLDDLIRNVIVLEDNKATERKTDKSLDHSLFM